MKRNKILFAMCFIMGLLFFCPQLSVESMAYESAWFPAPQMNLSQVAYEVGTGASHGNCNAIDILPGGRVFAPFTGIVKQVDSRWGYVLLQSTDKVYYADGTLDYMTVGFMHDENISNISVGQTITQGTAFYDAGGQGQKADGSYGHVYGNHVDISVFKGAVNSVSSYGKGNIYAYQAFYINKSKTTSIINKGKVETGHTTNNGAPTDWSNLWRELGSPSAPTINGATYPSAITLGSNFTAKGIISSNAEITWVWVGVQYGNGYTHALETSANPMTTSYDISKISGNINFSKLSSGNYTFQIDVISAGEYYTLVRQPFSIAEKPSVPEEFSISSTRIMTNESATLSWKPVDNATSYIINGWCDGKEVLWKGVNTTSYTLTSLPAGKYSFFVIALNNGISSGSSSGVNLEVCELELDVPEEISISSSKIELNGSATLSWKPVDNATSYIIDGWCDGKEVLWKSVNTTSYTLTSLPAGNYSFFVIAVCNGTSSESSLRANLEVLGYSTTGITYPSHLKFEENFTAKGTINSNTEITWVWVGVQYGNGYTHALETSANPMTTSYDISKISSNLDFSKLAVGDYTFQIDAIINGKYYEIIRKPFSIIEEHKECLEHIYDNGTITTPATCTEIGIKTYTCTVCNVSKTEIINATKHQNTELRNVKEATCIQEGYTGDTYCKDCNTQLFSGTTINKREHNWDEGKITINPKCTQKGMKIYTCTVCKVTRQEELSITDHKTPIVKFAKNASCKSEGYSGDIYCQDCGKMIKEGSIIAKLPHTKKTVKNSPATYFANGYTGDVVCSKCNTLLVRGKVSSKLTLAVPRSFKVTTGKKCMTVSIKKSASSSGTQIYYTTKSNMTRGKAIKTGATKTQVKKLTSKKVYYVRVRAYKKIGKKTVYSKWTTVKKIRVK